MATEHIHRGGSQVEYDEGEREDGDPDFVVETTLKLTLEEPEHIYLVDHAWTFQVLVKILLCRARPGSHPIPNMTTGKLYETAVVNLTPTVMTKRDGGESTESFRLLQPDSSW